MMMIVNCGLCIVHCVLCIVYCGWFFFFFFACYGRIVCLCLSVLSVCLSVCLSVECNPNRTTTISLFYFYSYFYYYYYFFSISSSCYIVFLSRCWMYSMYYCMYIMYVCMISRALHDKTQVIHSLLQLQGHNPSNLQIFKSKIQNPQIYCLLCMHEKKPQTSIYISPIPPQPPNTPGIKKTFFQPIQLILLPHM